MKAVILAAGRGTRMPEYTNTIPKALAPVAGVSVLERLLDALAMIDVTDIIITTGHFREQIEDFVASKQKYRDLAITYAFNPDFAETNYIYSMWLAREVIAGDDVLLMHGDMVFEQGVFERLASAEGSAVCIRDGGKLPEKDFKGRLRDGRVVEVGVNVFGDDARACMPVYKLREKDMDLWMREIGNFVEAKDLQCYAENALNRITDQVHIAPVMYSTDELCMEVDNMEDIRLAEEWLRKRQ